MKTPKLHRAAGMLALFLLFCAASTPGSDGVISCFASLKDAAQDPGPSLPSPLWAEKRAQIAALVPMTPEWIEHHSRNSLLTNRKIGKILGIKETTFQSYYVSGNAVPAHLRDKMERLLSHPGYLLRSKNYRSFSEWLRWHVINNPFGWTAREIEIRASMVPNSLSKLMMVGDSSRTPTESLIFTLVQVLQASYAKALTSARFNPESAGFSEWLRERLALLGVSPSEAAKRSGISVQQVYNFLNGKVRFPSRKSALLLARGLQLRDETVLLPAGYLPERPHFGDWVAEMLEWRGTSFESLVKRSELEADEVVRILSASKWPSRREVLKIGTVFGEVDMALSQAAMTPRLPGFPEFWKQHGTYTPEEEIAFATTLGIPVSELVYLVTNQAPRESVPNREIVRRFAQYRGLEVDSTLKTCGHKIIRLSDRVLGPKPPTAVGEGTRDRLRATGS